MPQEIRGNSKHWRRRDYRADNLNPSLTLSPQNGGMNSGSNVATLRRVRQKWTRAGAYGLKPRRMRRRWWRGRWSKLSPIMIMLPLAAFTAVLVWPSEETVDAPRVPSDLWEASEAEWRERIWPTSPEQLDAEQPSFASGGLADGAGAPRVAGFTQASARFSICGGGARVNCVVDGDTFWYAGEKIRVADINTAEVSEPACAREAALGRAATARLQALLNAGAFTLEPVDRDRDRYGRQIRTVTRGGESLGAVLVREGLAEEWRGRRGSWC